MIEIQWNAPFYDPSGYSSCARDYVMALHKYGCKVKLEPIRFWSPIKNTSISKTDIELLKELENNKVSPQCPRVQHIVPDCYANSKHQRPEIGYTVFETDGLPKQWANKMMMKTLIFVPCAFNFETFNNGGFPNNKMRVIPHIVHTERFDPDIVEPINIPIKKDFYFLTVMDVTYRKGWDILLRAYLREFKGDRNVGLVFKGYFGGVSQPHKNKLIEKLRAFRDSLRVCNPPDIIFFGDILQTKDIPSLYKACHCFVLPSRGEGWSLCHSEAMSMELPSIGPSWGGNTEFMNEKNSYLIDILEYRPVGKEMLSITPNYQNQNFAEPSEEHLRQLMRYVYENYSEAKKKGFQARKELVQNFNGKIISEKIVQALKGMT